ncbi:MAG: recombination protein RecR [Calditrichaeota bacterium]|nr:MAG: recombination protein RecR [Calditrichota bacterium]MBL1207756.1 recombination protein RecR [Calditrichota bacterium]NOG47590.1 recombination protein RecR [Calditrichota bacterium]
MSLNIPSLDELITQLAHLPGIGRKSAQRLAMHILKSNDGFADKLVNAIVNVKENTRICKRCFNLSENELCLICSDARRDPSKICVVEDIVDIMAIEGSREYKGIYHVLGGVVSPLAGVSVGDLKIAQLVERVKNENISEVLLALNLSTEGEATMIYISQLLKDVDVEITRIAHGVPMGSHLEFVDQTTIGRAIAGRQKL